MLSFDEPFPGMDEDGNHVTCNFRVTVSEEDAINIQRFVNWKTKGDVFDKKELLDDFIVIHWATRDKED